MGAFTNEKHAFTVDEYFGDLVVEKPRCEAHDK
jgi:hypothetical protein